MPVTMPSRPHPILLMMSDVKPFGGAENFFYLLVKHLDPALFACRVIVPREGTVVDRIRALGVPVHVLALRGPGDLRRLPAFVRLLRAHRIQLINAHGVRAGLYGALARKCLPVKVVVTEHNLQEWRGRLLPTMIDRFTARNNDRRITVSRAVADGMLASGVCGPEQVQVIHVAVETERHRPDAAAREKTRRALGVAPDEFAVVAAGRLHRMKGFIHLVEAAPRILERVPATRIIIAGDGEEKEALRRRIDELGLGERVRLPGFVENMPDLMRAADLFVLPSVEVKGAPREGLPMVIAEAMATGCPVVTTDVSGNKEIVTDGVNGRIVAQQDAAALAAGIIGVLSDPDRARLGENARRTAEESFGIQGAAARYARLFLELIEGGQATRAGVAG
jgi:glycosyltransferase involved in cell wall biosynthesis